LYNTKGGLSSLNSIMAKKLSNIKHYLR
jgi:hypothetical protein